MVHEFTLLGIDVQMFCKSESDTILSNGRQSSWQLLAVGGRLVSSHQNAVLEWSKLSREMAVNLFTTVSIIFGRGAVVSMVPMV